MSIKPLRNLLSYYLNASGAIITIKKLALALPLITLLVVGANISIKQEYLYNWPVLLIALFVTAINFERNKPFL